MRAVVFDCFGVLCGSSYELLLAECAPERVSDLKNLNKQADYGYISGEEYVAGVAEILGWTRERAADVIRQARARNEPLISYVKNIHERGAKTALLSNVSSDTLRDLFAAGELEVMFDEQILSFAERLAKPNPAVFELVAERLGVDPADCLMIDDRIENCEGAEVAGMEAALHATNFQTIQRVDAWLEEKNA